MSTLTRSKCCDESVSRPGHSGPWLCDGCGGYAYSELGMTEALRIKDETQLLLRAAPISELLTKAYALTHRMDYADRQRRAARSCGQREIEREASTEHADLRAMRDLITAEIERRCAR